MISSGSEIVDEVGKIPFTGNILAHNWFNTIKLENGKPDTIAIILLSEIVYWYKPSEVKDEKTGMFLGYKKRFKADLLQRTYESFSEQFGFTKRQVKDACKRLEDMSLIKRHFRTITAKGKKLGNVLFIELNTDKLKEVTIILPPYDVKTSEGYDVKTSEGVTLKRQTNTESTNTKNTINNKESVSPPPASPKNKNNKGEKIAFAHNVLLTQIQYETLVKQHSKELIDRKIEDMSKWQDSPNGKSYKNHYQAMRMWLKREAVPNNQNSKSRRQQEVEELERLLRERGA